MTDTQRLYHYLALLAVPLFFGGVIATILAVHDAVLRRRNRKDK